MNDKISIKVVLWKFEFRIVQTPEAIMTYLWVNATDSIMPMDKPMIKDIKRRLAGLINPKATAST